MLVDENTGTVRTKLIIYYITDLADFQLQYFSKTSTQLLMFTSRRNYLADLKRYGVPLDILANDGATLLSMFNKMIQCQLFPSKANLFARIENKFR